MVDALIADFLAGYDENRFPKDFLSKFELMECLAHNEMGETFLIKDRQSGDYCVAKCYPDSSPLFQTTEGELLKKLDHPGLPAWTGEYRSEKMTCIVRTFTQGRPVDQLARETPLSQVQSINMVVQLCDILTYLHRQDPPIIHRDIKPQNIIVDSQGKVTLIDFGIARTYHQTALEDTQHFGTRQYAAPEQFGFSQTDCRTDIYALGILLCWLLTGSGEVSKAKITLSNHRLVNVITKCTAFDPQDRYENASQVRDALTGRMTRCRMFAFPGAALLILAAVLGFLNNGIWLKPPSGGVSFKEPLVEKAVRLTLQKNADELISEHDLLTITDLYVFGDKAAANAADFKTYAENFANNGGIINRGSIQVLDDLVRLKNLRTLSLAYQNISDLTPLAGLTDLEYIDLRHNPLEDVSPLASLVNLELLTLFDTNISDLTILNNCTRLTNLDVGDTLIRSISALDGLDSLQVLAARKAPLQSLEHIEAHRLIVEIYLSETQLIDLTPLLKLPRLKLVEVSENMSGAAEAVADLAQFSIQYQ